MSFQSKYRYSYQNYRYSLYHKKKKKCSRPSNLTLSWLVSASWQALAKMMALQDPWKWKCLTARLIVNLGYFSECLSCWSQDADALILMATFLYSLRKTSIITDDRSVRFRMLHLFSLYCIWIEGDKHRQLPVSSGYSDMILQWNLKPSITFLAMCTKDFNFCDCWEGSCSSS